MAPLTENVVLGVLEALNLRLMPSQRLLPEELLVQTRMLLDDLAGWDAPRFLAAAKLCRRRSPWLPTTPDLVRADGDIQAERPSRRPCPHALRPMWSGTGSRRGNGCPDRRSPGAAAQYGG
jgi:hypothetical protein